MPIERHPQVLASLRQWAWDLRARVEQAKLEDDRDHLTSLQTKLGAVEARIAKLETTRSYKKTFVKEPAEK